MTYDPKDAEIYYGVKVAEELIRAKSGVLNKQERIKVLIKE